MPGQGRLSVIDHVEIEALPGIEVKLRWFYGELAGLVPVSTDGDVEPPVLRFKSQRFELRITMVEAPVIESVDCRVNCEVFSLEEVAATLEECKYPFAWIRGLRFTDRALTLLDPAGNRVLIRRLWPARL